MTRPSETKPDDVLVLEAAYGAPSQAGFGSAVFYELIKVADNLEKTALEKYRYFVGELWERYGKDAWMGPWKEVYARKTVPSRTWWLNCAASKTPMRRCRYRWSWTHTSNYWQVRSEVLEQMKLRFDQAGIRMPYPQQDVYVHQADGRRTSRRMLEPSNKHRTL